MLARRREDVDTAQPEECSSPLAESGSMMTSVWNFRRVLVRGTTWMTVGAAVSMRWAVTMTAGGR